jgi:hypothetical protein
MDEYPGPAVSGDVVKVADLAKTSTPQALQDLVNLIRSTAGMQRIVFTSMAQALTLRGTAAQMAAAERLIQQAEK